MDEIEATLAPGRRRCCIKAARHRSVHPERAHLSEQAELEPDEAAGEAVGIGDESVLHCGEVDDEHEDDKDSGGEDDGGHGCLGSGNNEAGIRIYRLGGGAHEVRGYIGFMPRFAITSNIA